MIFETQEQVDAALQKWQVALRLQDWVVTARIAEPRSTHLRRDGEDGLIAARVYHNIKLKEASIFLCPTCDFPGDCHTPQDHEKALVHELLHLHFEPVDAITSDDLTLPMEQMIEALAKSFVALDRRDSVR